MLLETNNVYLIEYTWKDGSVRNEIHIFTGETWQGSPATFEVLVN